MAAAGTPVFPMRVSKDDHGKWNKKPAITGWRTKASTDSKVIKRWAREFPGAVFAIELEKAGLVVIDCDRHRDDVDGCKAFKELLDANGVAFPKVPVTRTSGNGLHIFLKQPEVPIRCPVKTKLPPGVEVKGAGGNIVSPGSLRPDGADWRPVTTDGHPTLPHAYCNGLAVIPPWLEELAGKVAAAEPRVRPHQKQKPSRSASEKRREEAYAKAALDRQGKELAGTAAGGRNKALNGAAFSLGSMAARKWIDASEVKAALFDAAKRCGLVKDNGDTAVRATIASGIKAGLRKPHNDLKDREPPYSHPSVPLSIEGPTRSKPKATDDWRSKIQKTDTGKVIPNLNNTLLVLENDPAISDRFSFNEMSRAIMLGRAIGGPSHPRRMATNVDVTDTQRWLQINGNIRISKEIVAQAMESRAVLSSYHPIRDYLTGFDGTMCAALKRG
jgi:hypothetical protein